MSSCKSCAARPSMRSVENSPSRQRSSPQAKNQWRDDFLAGGQCGIQVRDSDQRDDFVQDFKSKRSRDQEISRPRDFETKIGDQTMMHRLSREENQPSVRRPAFSKAEAIAMSAMISRRGGEGRGLVHSAAKAAESSTPQRRPRNSPRENGITESSRHGSRC